MKGYDSRAVANFFVAKFCADNRLLTIMQLVKFVYLAHGWHLGFIGKPLICHRVEAWKFGPVIVEVYDAFRPKGITVRDKAKDDDDRFYDAAFNPDALGIMESVCDAYSQLPVFVLSNLTHKPGTPWFNAAMERGHYAHIRDAEIRDYYERLIKERGEVNE